MNFSFIFSAMLQLFLIAALGFACRKLNILPDGTKDVLSRLLLTVTAPCTILSAAVSETFDLSAGRLLTILAAAFGVYALAVVISWIMVRVLRVPVDQRGVFLCLHVFSNCGFMGFPVVETLFGTGALLYATIYNIPSNVVLFTLGPYAFQRDAAVGQGKSDPPKITWRSFINPNLIACLISLVLVISRIRLPGFLVNTIVSVGRITTPGALLVIGMMIAEIPIRSMLGNVRVYLACAVRLVLIPVAVWLVMRFLFTDPILLGVTVVIFGMPTATMVSMLANQYGANEKLATQGVFLSTVLSMITIPILVMLLY